VRDPKKVRLVPLRKFAADGVTPVPGLQLNIDGKPAQIRAVGAGRVQVDYNHPFAGKTLIYDVSVQKIIETEDDKVRNLIHKRLPTVDQQKFIVKIDANSLEVEFPEDAFFLEGLQVEKRTLTADIEKYLPKIDIIKYIETFKKPSSKPASTTESKPSTEPEVPVAPPPQTPQPTAQMPEP
jgi:peptidylprolyl isomerase